MRALAAALLALGVASGARAEPLPPPAEGSVRVAAFNASLSRAGAGVAWKDVAEGDAQPRAVAEIIRRVRPDVLLVLELDHDLEGRALGALAALIAEDGAAPGVDYRHRLAAPMNTGVPTGLDLDGDGAAAGPSDAQGWGRFPGQYGMALLSRLPIEGLRSFRRLLWAEMPGSLMPGAGMPEAAAMVQRLSSKSHWDVTLRLPGGETFHLLASHPTPPVFDGPEDRNGRRNHDEIRFWIDYVSGEDWMTDDAGRRDGLAPGAAFVVAGDLNADPADGEARRAAIAALLSHPRVQDPAPRSAGAASAAAAQGGANARHRGDPALDTADWRDKPEPGNLRVDYVLPSTDWEVTAAGVFWPAPGAPGAALVEGGRRPASSDHRLVWVDLRPDGR